MKAIYPLQTSFITAVKPFARAFNKTQDLKEKVSEVIVKMLAKAKNDEDVKTIRAFCVAWTKKATRFEDQTCRDIVSAAWPHEHKDEAQSARRKGKAKPAVIALAKQTLKGFHNDPEKAIKALMEEKNMRESAIRWIRKNVKKSSK